MPKYLKLFNELDKTMEFFISETNRISLTNMATDRWTSLDVLRHVTFWHKYYADQYKSLAAGKKPFIFTSKGGSTRNQEGVDSLKNRSREDLIKMLNQSQRSLRKSILTKMVPEMDYTDKRHYKTEEFLDVVTHHIQRHTSLLNNQTKLTRRSTKNVN